jgi:hypothetical protein
LQDSLARLAVVATVKKNQDAKGFYKPMFSFIKVLEAFDDAC